MMNETLQKELSAHLRVINGRDNFIKKWAEKKEKEIKGFGRDWKGQDEILQLIHLKAKKYLDKKSFDFESELKGRNGFGDRIIWENGFLKIRRYRTHNFYNIGFGNEKELYGFMPNGFSKCIDIIDKKLERIKEISTKFKGTIKLNKRNDFNFIDETELKKDKAIKIILGNRKREAGYYSNSDIRINIEGENYLRNEEWAYHNTRVFKKILKLMNKFEKNLNNLIQVRERLRKEAEDFVNKDFDKILILESLKEDERD